MLPIVRLVLSIGVGDIPRFQAGSYPASIDKSVAAPQPINDRIRHRNMQVQREILAFQGSDVLV
jgi:hypothetical protein